MNDIRTEWQLCCDCSHGEHWQNFLGTHEHAAWMHLRWLRNGGHPVKLFRRTVTPSEWQEVTDELA